MFVVGVAGLLALTATAVQRARLVLHLAAAEEDTQALVQSASSARRVVWDEAVVDNENLGRKSSKSACLVPLLLRE
jgi:hypothetical protein